MKNLETKNPDTKNPDSKNPDTKPPATSKPKITRSRKPKPVNPNDLNFTVTNVFKRNLNSKAAVVLNCGGARSSKSYSICQLFIYKMLSEKNKNFLITRKTMPALRITAMKLFIDLMKLYGFYVKAQYNKTAREFSFNSNYLLFSSLDESTKIQSTEFNYIWMEEAEEFSYDDFMTLKTRLSATKNKNEVNQMFLSYNPKKESSYINKKVANEKNVQLIKSSYKDNPLLSADYIRLLKDIKEQSPEYYKIFALGEYAINEGIIFTNIRNKDVFPDEVEETVYGLDFGYNNPSALVKVDIKDGAYYLSEIIYETKLTNSALIERMLDLIPNRRKKIYCDSAEPARIKELRNAGFNAIAANKNVKDGIEFVRRCEIYTNLGNVNLNKEVDEYSYKKNRNGEYLEEPIGYSSHFPDAIRYAIFGFNKVKVPNVRFFNF